MMVSKQFILDSHQYNMKVEKVYLDKHIDSRQI